MAQTKCTRTGVTDGRAALINKWLALPGTKQLGIDSMQKWSFCMSNKVLNKAVHACFETVPSRGLYGEAKSVGVLFLCLLLFPFVLCCALFSLEGWPTGSYSSASAKGSTTALIPLVSSLSVETSTEHWQSKKFLQQVTVISSTNTLSSEYDLSLDIFIFDDSMQVSVKVNHQLLAYILFHSLCLFLSIPVEICKKSLCKVMSMKCGFGLFHPHFFICCWNICGHHKAEQTLILALQAF